jgi:hypothetical protein
LKVATEKTRFAINLVDKTYNELDIPNKECINLIESFLDIIKENV